MKQLLLALILCLVVNRSGRAEEDEAKPEPLAHISKHVEFIIADEAALCGDSKKAVEFWKRLSRDSDADIKTEAKARLEWARQLSETTGDLQPFGAAYAIYCRNRFLAADAEKRAELIKEYLESNDHGAVMEAYHEWILAVLAEDKDFQLYELITEGGLSWKKEWIQSFVEGIADAQWPKDPRRCELMFKAAGFLKKPDLDGLTAEVEALRWASAQIEGNKLLDRVWSDNRAAIVKQLRANKALSLVGKLYIASVEDSSGREYGKVLDANEQLILDLKEEDGAELLEQIKRFCPRFPFNDLMDPGVYKTLAGLIDAGEFKSIDLSADFKRIFASEKFRSTNGRGGAVLEAARLIADLAKQSPEKARIQLAKAMEILSETPEQKDPEVSASRKPLATLLACVLYHPGMFNPVLKTMADNRILDDTLWLESLAMYNDHEVFSRRSCANIVEEFFTKNRFVADAKDFDPLAFQQGVHPYSVLGSLVENIKWAGIGDEVARELRARQPGTFGSELVAVMLTKTRDDVLPFLEKHEEDLKNVPPSRRHAVKQCLDLADGELRYLDRIPAKTLALLKPLLEEDNSDLGPEIDKWMKAKSLVALNLTAQSCKIPAQKLLDKVAKQDPAAALRLAHKVGDLIAAYPDKKAPDAAHESDHWKARVAAIPELFEEFTREWDKKDGIGRPAWLSSVSYCLVHPYSAERAVQMLNCGHLLDDVQTFRAYRDEYGRPETWLGSIVGWIKSDPKALAAAEVLLSKKKSTFGVELTKAMLSKKPEALREFVGKHRDELVQLPLERHGDLTCLMELDYGSWLQLAAASPEWNDALGPLLPDHSKRIQARCDQMLAATKIEEVIPDLDKHAANQGTAWVAPLVVISEMMFIDEVKAARAYEHMVELASAAPKAVDVEEETASSRKREPAPPYAIQFVSQGYKYPALAPLSISYAMDETKEHGNLRDLSVGVIDNITKPVHSRVLVLKSGWLTDADKFDATLAFEYSDLGDNDQSPRKRTLLEILVKDATTREAGVRESMVEMIKNRKPQTFGGDLLVALLNRSRKASVQAFLKVHQADLEKLAPDSRGVVVGLLRKAWPGMPEM